MLRPRDLHRWAIMDKSNGSRHMVLIHMVDKTLGQEKETRSLKELMEQAWYKPKIKTGIKIQIYVPKNLRRLILEEAHSSPYGGHLGREKLYSILEKRVYWPGMRTQVAEFTRDCLTCRKSKHAAINIAPMKNIRAKLPFYRVSVDVYGPLPETVQKNKYVFVFTCQYTKFLVTYCTPNHVRQTLIRVLMKFCADYGTPYELHMDQGSEMRSHDMEETCGALGINLEFSAAYHHQTLGEAEKNNKTLGDALKCYVTHERQHDWDEYIDSIIMAYRNSTHGSTRLTPHYLVYGHDQVMPMDILLGTYVWDYRNSS